MSERSTAAGEVPMGRNLPCGHDMLNLVEDGNRQTFCFACYCQEQQQRLAAAEERARICLTAKDAWMDRASKAEAEVKNLRPVVDAAREWGVDTLEGGTTARLLYRVKALEETEQEAFDARVDEVHAAEEE